MVRFRRLPRTYPQFVPLLAAKTAARVLLSCILAGLFVWLLAQRLDDIHWADVRAGFIGVQPLHWLAALLATAISFWAVGQYDAVLHRHFATRLPDLQNRRAGICAIAVSQTTGLGVITGTVVRWRMLPGQNLALALRLTVAVAVSFLLGWAVVTAVVVLAVPGAPFKAAASLVLAVAIAAAALCIVSRPNLARQTRFKLPNGITIFQLLSLCAVDTLAAGLAFYLLCPNGLDMGFAQVLPIFLLALGAGLLSGTPGGVGAFELTLLALLPSVAEPALLAAVVAWRVIYYALPAVIGAAWAIRGAKPVPVSALAQEAFSQTPCARPRSAFAGMMQQGQQNAMPIGAADEWLRARTPHVLVGLFDPADPRAIAELILTAKSENRLPTLYHASARLAVAARRQGFCALRIAVEAVVCPALYDLATPSRARLRRKLRAAQTAGVIVTTANHHGPVPWPQLDAIAAGWASAHGGERGFSMGRYSRDYVRQQGLYIAWVDARPVAFVTFHQTRDAWALDIMRHVATPPDGVMHLLIHTAIMDAARHSVTRLSLAAVPDIVIGRRGSALHRLITRLTAKKTTGLWQFKSSFAPDWCAVYLAVPHPADLPLICAELAREVFWPKPLPTAPQPPLEDRIDHHPAEYEFASARSAWHRRVE